MAGAVPVASPQNRCCLWSPCAVTSCATLVIILQIKRNVRCHQHRRSSMHTARGTQGGDEAVILHFISTSHPGATADAAAADQHAVDESYQTAA